LFKFIVPDNPLALSRVQALFHEKTQLQYKKSIKGNYISVSGKELMMNAQEVISRYHKAEKIEGIVML
jgi:putative lipoic acid-binding regulatory protein